MPENKNIKDKHTKKLKILGENVFSAKIYDLLPFTMYRIYVSAFNLIGKGPSNSNLVLVTTAENCNF